MSHYAHSNRGRLQQFEVLIADPDTRLARLVRYVLEDFGFRHIHTARSGMEAIELLRHKAIDFVIAEWPLEPAPSINFVHHIRHMEEEALRDIPIILLTARAEQHDVERARDSGVTEFVVKPFTASTLSHRITQVIDHPRAFVISRDFIGPERRRHAASQEADKRRLSEAEKNRHATRRGNKTIYHIHDQEIIVYKPDRSLKQLLGPDISAADIFDETVVREAQSVIWNMKTDFVSWVQEEIKRLEEAYGKARSDPQDTEALQEISEAALTIKAQSGTFGYDFATAVSKQLFDFTAALRTVDPLALTIIRKHIDTLYVIFQKEFHGSGPEIGDEVLSALLGLIDKHTRAGLSG